MNNHVVADREPVSGSLSDGASALAAFYMEPATYLHELDGMDLTEAQKIELLETVWQIMRTFVELGVSVDICGQFLGIPDEEAQSNSDALDSFNQAAAGGKEDRHHG